MSAQSPYFLIVPLWRSARTVEVTTKQLQSLLLYYSPDHVHFRMGRGYALKHKRIGPSVYSVWLEEKVYA